MTLASEIIGVQTLAAGERVGYAGTFVADRPMRVGVVARMSSRPVNNDPSRSFVPMISGMRRATLIVERPA